MRVGHVAYSPDLRFTRAFFYLVVLLTLFTGQGIAGQEPTAPPSPSQWPIPAQPDAADREQFLPYWTSETGWNSELQLRNNAINEDLTVTPVLRLADGAETSLAPVTIKPQEVKSVDIDAAVAAASAPQFVGTFGSVVLRYRSPSLPVLYASLMIHRIGHPIAFHIDAVAESMEFQAGSREGIWWLPKDTTSDYLVLTNQGENPIPLVLSLYDSTGKESKQNLLLAPLQTSRYSVRKLVQTAGLVGSYGGIEVSAAAHAGSLDTLHFLFDETAGFSAILKMFDYDPNTKLEERDHAKTGTWTLRAPMLALSNPDPALAFPPGTTLHPRLFIRNTTSKPADAALRFHWRAASTTGAATGPLLHLNPYATRLVDVAALQGTGAIPKEANWTSVTLTTNGLPGEVLAVAASYDDTLRYGAQSPFSDQLSFRWEGGKLQYDPYHDSIITGGNGDTKPTRLAFTIFYNQGTQRYDLAQTQQPDEQMWIDVGKLIREHVPDKNGKTLPADLTSGSYEFRDLTNIGVGSLFEGKVIYDKTYGHVAYGCGTCCGYYQPKFFYDPLLVPVGSTAGNGVTALDQCTQKYDDVSADFYGNWSTANTAIVTVDYYGTHRAVSAGSTTSNTSGWLQHYGHLDCPDWNPTPRGTANVKPTITSVSPARGLIGATTKSVTITGKGLSGGHVNTPAAIQVSNITTATDAQITFDAVISTTAIPGNNAAAIYVTVSGEDSNKVDFYVQVPTSLSIVAGSASKTNEVLCGAGACGTIPTFKYKVNDQDSPTAQPIRASMSMWD